MQVSLTKLMAFTWYLYRGKVVLKKSFMYEYLGSKERDQREGRAVGGE